MRNERHPWVAELFDDAEGEMLVMKSLREAVAGESEMC
jgi:hypothetical protein